MMIERRLQRVLAVALALLSAGAGSARGAALELYTERRPAMGTEFEIRLYATDAVRASEAFEVAFDEIERVEAALSNYRPTSELSRINASASSRPVVTDPEVFRFLETAIDLSRRSDGAFDMTVGRLMRAWGFFRGEGRLPTDAELAEARRETGWRYVALDAAARSVRFERRVELDPGAIGKGYAIDRVAAVLAASGVRSALVVAGTSTIYAMGAPPGASGWRVTVPDPLDRTRTLSTVLLRDNAISTTGSYEKFFRIGDATFCHIMDPRTGRPVEGMLQTSVVATTGIASDGLSTALFVLGPAKGRALLESYASAGALFVTTGGASDRVVALDWSGDRR
jgi:thiamine biosynthesis lipoprotein